MEAIWLTLGFIFAGLLVLLLASYNGLASLREQVRGAWRQMDEQLRRRYDLIPDVLNIARAAGVETSAVATAKNRAAVAFNPEQLAEAEGRLTAAIDQLLRDASANPGLAENPAFDRAKRALLAGVAAVAEARHQYNTRVLSYNIAVASFPYTLTGRLMGFTAQPFFEFGGKARA